MLPQTPERQRSIDRLHRRIDSIRDDIYRTLTPWQRVLVARHPNRPTVLDYVNRLFTEFTEISGDRRFADDHAIVAGFARYKGEPVLVVGHHKGGGGDTKQKIYRNFGYARPEGYRKALRAMKLAEKFSRPVIAFIDTPAAYPGMESEERGISEAIALNLREMAALDMPIVVVVHGEGGSGGALGIAVGDRILMHEFAIYSVIPPEGCAAILWRDSNRKVEAAEALKLTAPDLLGSASSTRSCRSRSAAPTRTTSWRRRCSTRRCRGRSPRCGRWDRRPASTRATGSGARWATSAWRKDDADMDSTRTADDQPDLGDAGARRRAGRGARARARRLAGHRPAAVHPRPRRPRRARRFLSPSLDDLHDPFRLADMHDGRGAHSRRHRAARAHRDPRRLRRRRRHLDGHPAARARAARRRRHPLHSRAAARRLRAAAGVARSAARRRRAPGHLGGLRHPRRGGGAARARARPRSRSSPITTSPTSSCRARSR